MTEHANPLYGANVARKDIPAEYKWDVASLYTTEDEWEKARCEVMEEVKKLEHFKGELKNPETLAEALSLRDRLSEKVSRIYAYARLQQDADNGDAHFQKLTGQAETALAEFSNAESYIEPEILALTDEERQNILGDARLAVWNFNLQDLFRRGEHVLPEEQEKILTQSQLATSTGSAAFRALVSADMEFPAIKDGNGREATVSEGNYMLNMMSRDRTLRKNSFESLLGTYRNYRNTLAATLTGACRRERFYALAEKYPDSRSGALDAYNIPVSVYDRLIETVRANLAPLHEYIALKKSALRVEELHPYDLYVPLADETEGFALKFDDACKMVEAALAPLGEEYVKTLHGGLTGGWVDVYENKGKRSGAYSWGVYGAHPFVLLNYQPRYTSISTIAHEMGHAMHSYLTNREQPYATSDYSIFCAEVASTTNECLLLHYAMKKADKKQKIYLLNQLLEAVRTTLYRQVQFAEFEKYIHDKVGAGESLQADDMEKYWRKSNAEYYGLALTVDELLGSEVSRIPHFYTPFYVYQYATGYSAATAFAEAILSGAAGARDRYLKFLRSGASDYSLNLLADAGVDLNTPQPVQVTLDKFAAALAELKDLLRQ